MQLRIDNDVLCFFSSLPPDARRAVLCIAFSCVAGPRLSSPAARSGTPASESFQSSSGERLPRLRLQVVLGDVLELAVDAARRRVGVREVRTALPR